MSRAEQEAYNESGFVDCDGRIAPGCGDGDVAIGCSLLCGGLGHLSDMGSQVLYVAQQYGGMDPAQMEGFWSNYYGITPYITGHRAREKPVD